MAQERGRIGVISMTTPSVTVAGLRSMGLSPNLQHVRERGGGPDPTFQAIMNANPMINVSTTQISAVGSIGIDGAAGGGVSAYFHKMKFSDSAEAYTAAKHLKLTAATAALLPRTLQASVNQIATFQFDIMGISSDGTTVPIVPTANQVMPDPGDPSSLWTLGPVSINGTDVDVESIEVTFGIEEDVIVVEGNVYPTKWQILRRNPMIRIPGPELDLIATLGLEGDTQGATDSTVVFRKITPNGGRVSGITAEHVQVAIDDGLIYTENVQGEDGLVRTDLVIMPAYDGTNAILTITTDATF